PGAENYGSIDAEIPEQVMQNVAYRLFRDISNNQYDTYLFGVFAVHKSLDNEKRQRVLNIFEEITGKSVYQVDDMFGSMDLAKIMETRDLTAKQAKEFLKKDYYKKLADEFTPNHAITLLYNYEEYMPVREDLSYDEFKKLLNELKSIIGRKTADYENLSSYGSVPLTYDTALARYEAFVNEDRISGAYARLFCDYMGILLGFIPACIATEAAMGGRWRKKFKMKDFSLFEPDTNIVWSRFITIAAMTFIPVVLFAVAATLELSAGVRPLGLTIDYFAFIKYSVVWLLPTVMFATAIGLFFTILTEKPVGILVQLILWLWSLMTWGQNGLVNIKYGANMFIRHNVVGEYQIYLDSQGTILLNRAAYTILSLALITVVWYLQKTKEN
ncbi:MAG TPA: hypothetical protein VM577_17155, partial [Anaerovoracaceae bacterium]|nr:hypothetical protein [Anaerovoracaceae bacterium]